MMKSLPDWNASINDLVPFSKIRVIVSDIDGTLLTSGNSHDHNKFERLVKNLKSKGIYMTFATGRSYNGVQELLKTFPIDKGTPIMLYNGSVCIVPFSERIILKETININSLKKMIFLAKEYDTTLLAYEIAKRSNSQSSFIRETVYAWGKYQPDFSEPNGLPVLWERDYLNISPVAVLIKNIENSMMLKELLSKIGDIAEITATKSTQYYIEIRPIGSNKGRAIESICSFLRLEKSSILAIGDNDNDVEMLEYAGISVAVNNSSVAALNAGKYKSTGSNIIGVLETLELVWQANRYISIMGVDKL